MTAMYQVRVVVVDSLPYLNDAGHWLEVGVGVVVP